MTFPRRILSLREAAYREAIRLPKGLVQDSFFRWEMQRIARRNVPCRFSKVPDDYPARQYPGRECHMQKIVPFLWFDGKAEEAVRLYTSIFKNSKVLSVSRYGDAGPGPKGTVMTMTFELDGQRFIALNGGPQFKFTEAVSFLVNCKTQAEVDEL